MPELTPIDLTRGCGCKEARHRHGQYTTYVRHACRCTPCREANNDLSRQRTRSKAYGRFAFVDAEPVRQHVQRLMAQGMGHSRVADAAGVHRSTMTYLLYGSGGAEHRPPRKQIRRDTAEKLLAVGLDLAPGAKVPATGARRRVEALMWNGWSASLLARRLGVTPTNFFYLRGRVSITRATHEAVVALFEELWDESPPCSTHREKISVARTMRTARERGFAPPAAWDDDTIDAPSARPSGARREAVAA